MSRRDFDVAVIGAGPAGSAAAITLAEKGHSVLLLEKDAFPREKVCGEFLSSDALSHLDRLGALAPLRRLDPEEIVRGSLHLPRGAAVSFRLPTPALGVSRLRLDDLLARRAAEAGAEVRFRQRVSRVEGVLSSGFRVRTSALEGETEISALAVIGAWGRWNALDRAFERGFLRGPKGFLGWSRDFVGKTDSLAGEVRLYLFPGGYCGLSRVEGERANLAGVVSERTYSRTGGGWSAVLEHARRANGDLDRDLAEMTPGPRGFLGVGPVFFVAKPPSERDILMVGDAAGVIDPFSGQGQAGALFSGIMAGKAVFRFLAKDLSSSDLVPMYSRAWKRNFRRRFAWSAAFRAMILNPSLGRVAGRIAGERLVRFAIAATRSGPTVPSRLPA